LSRDSTVVGHTAPSGDNEGFLSFIIDYTRRKTDNEKRDTGTYRNFLYQNHENDQT
jgi:hypothetical protein